MTKRLCYIGVFVALLSVGAYLRIPISGGAVSLQTLFAMLCGVVIGRKNACICVGVYLAVGLIGLPVFSLGGGLSYLAQPTFGYLLGLFPLAVLSSMAFERFQNKKMGFWGFALLLFLSAIPTLMIGSIYLCIISGSFTLALIKASFLIYLPVEFLKGLVCASAVLGLRNYSFFRHFQD
ncbi:MAG: biotin transporter BioY [Clostridia bacterium]|nr:biotin transporter BioY [Clostridia bacterium]